MKTDNSMWLNLRKLKNNESNRHGQPTFISDDQSRNFWIQVTKSLRSSGERNEPFKGSMGIYGPNRKEAEIIASKLKDSGIYSMDGKFYVWRKAQVGDPIPLVAAYGKDFPVIRTPKCEKEFWDNFFV